MKDKISVSDEAKIQIIKAKDKMINSNDITPKGIIEVIHEKANGDRTVVFKGENTIENDLRQYFVDSMQQVVDNAMDNLSTSQSDHNDIVPTGIDGIIIDYSNSHGYIMSVTEVTPTNTYGVKWRGEYTFEGSETVSNALLGHDFSAFSGDFFLTRYASRTFTTINPAQSDKIIINWEIYV